MANERKDYIEMAAVRGVRLAEAGSVIAGSDKVAMAIVRSGEMMVFNRLNPITEVRAATEVSCSEFVGYQAPYHQAEASALVGLPWLVAYVAIRAGRNRITRWVSSPKSDATISI